MDTSEIQPGATLLLVPILKLKKPESFRGWDSFNIQVESLTDKGVIDTNGEEFLFIDYKITRG
jgi:hypothetical protein